MRIATYIGAALLSSLSASGHAEQSLGTILSKQQYETNAVRTVDNITPALINLGQNWSLSGGFATLNDARNGEIDHVWSATAYYQTAAGVKLGLGMGETIIDEAVTQPVRHYRLALGYDLAQQHSDITPIIALSRIGNDIEMTAGLAVSLSF